MYSLTMPDPGLAGAKGDPDSAAAALAAATSLDGERRGWSWGLIVRLNGWLLVVNGWLIMINSG